MCYILTEFCLAIIISAQNINGIGEQASEAKKNNRINVSS